MHWKKSESIYTKIKNIKKLPTNTKKPDKIEEHGFLMIQSTLLWDFHPQN